MAQKKGRNELIEGLKGKSPFYPGQPVPVDLFVGRKAQIERILSRGVGQVVQGKPQSIFIQGEYGIGKSSFAGFISSLAERDYPLHSIYAPLGGAKTLNDAATFVLEATVRSGAFNPQRSDKMKNWLAKYIGKQQLFGFSLDLTTLKQDAPQIATASGMLGFLTEVKKRLQDTDVKGIVLVLDEINGITSDSLFAHFIKGLVDTNAMSKEPLPLLLMLYGVEERRREMISKHQPVDRIFDVIEIEPMSVDEMKEFFHRAFESVGMTIDEDAMEILIRYSAGFPKIMHLIGDSVYWIDKDEVVDKGDAVSATFAAAEEVGAKYVDQQVYKALRSTDYRSILEKIAKMGSDEMTFSRKQVAAGLTTGEKKKLDNFLRKMKELKVIRQGDVSGEYTFNSRMVRLYIWLQSLKEKK
jgi:hypothetical protein